MPRRTPPSTPPSAEPPDDNAAPLSLAPADRAALYAARRFIGSSLERTAQDPHPLRRLLPGSARRRGKPGAGVRRGLFRALGAGPRRRPHQRAVRGGRLRRPHGNAGPARPLGQGPRSLPRPGRHAAESAQHHGPAVPPGERLGHRAACARLLRKRVRPRATHSLGIRGQPADCRAARGSGRERLLRPGTASRCSSTTSIATTSASTRACRPTSSITSSATRCSTASGRSTSRPCSPETAAFHEFIGDLTAILIALRNTAVPPAAHRRDPAAISTRDSTLSRVAEQFGRAVQDQPYLRSAINKLTMKDVADDQRPHFMSQVLTGAMFDIIIRLSRHYVEKRGRTVPQAFWDTIQRMQNMAIQPLDLLPPVDVTFSDYALAVLRAEEIANPTDPDDYRGMMLDVVHQARHPHDVGRDRAAQAAPHLRAARSGRVPRRRHDRELARRCLPLSRRQPAEAVHSRRTPMSRRGLVHGAEADAPGTPAAEAGAPAIHLARGRRARGTAVRALRRRRRRACCAAARSR